MVKWAINSVRALIARYTWWCNEPIQQLDWDSVIQQVKVHQNEMIENSMPHKDKQYNTPVAKALHIKDLFEARDEAYNGCTEAILQHLMPTLIQGTLEYFELTNDDVTWVHISMNHPGVVILIGTIVDDQETVEVPVPVEVVEPADGTRYVRIAIPVDKLEGSTKQNILDYFKSLEENSDAVEDQAMALLGEQMGFDLTQLTRGQREKLLMTLNASINENTTHQ